MNNASLSPVYIPLIDTHAHVNLPEFEPDIDVLIARSRAGRFPPVKGRALGVDPVVRPFISGLICPAVDLDSSLRALALSRKYDFIFAAVGAHPNHISRLRPGEWEEICRLIEKETPFENGARKLVALGETGLDRHWDDTPFELQRDFFIRALEQGRQMKMPVVIHSRDSNDDLDELLCDFYSGVKPDWPVGVVHSFSGTPEQAERWLELGFYLGFGGFVTYPNKNFSNVWDAARLTPSDRLLLETDCPFLTPHPVRGKIERNEPLLTAFVAKRLAQLRDASTAEIARMTAENARRLFQLPELPDKPSESPNDEES